MILRKIKSLVWFVLFVGLFVSSALAQTDFLTKKLIDVSQNNPTGTYTSGSFSLQGCSRIKGAIVLNSGSGTTPTISLNQTIATSTPFWFGTNTTSFHYNGTYWYGEIDIPILGKYGRLIVGNFGDSTNWQGYLYATNEYGDKFIEAQRNETVNNVRLTYFVDKYSDTYGVSADRFNSYNLGTAAGYVYDDTGGSGTSSGSVAIRGFDMIEITININSIVAGTVTIRIQEQVGTTTFWSNIADIVLGSATSYSLSLDERPWSVRIGLNKTGNGTASVSVAESYSTKIK